MKNDADTMLKKRRFNQKENHERLGILVNEGEVKQLVEVLNWWQTIPQSVNSWYQIFCTTINFYLSHNLRICFWSSEFAPINDDVCWPVYGIIHSPCTRSHRGECLTLALLVAVKEITTAKESRTLYLENQPRFTSSNRYSKTLSYTHSTVYQ